MKTIRWDSFVGRVVRALRGPMTPPWDGDSVRCPDRVLFEAAVLVAHAQGYGKTSTPEQFDAHLHRMVMHDVSLRIIADHAYREGFRAGVVL